MSKYSINPEENEILPNLLNAKDKEVIEKAEFEGFLYAELLLSKTLTPETKFNVAYIQNIHLLALKEVYSFAGQYRTVNISKGGFFFPAAQYLIKSMELFETEILNNLPDSYNTNEDLIRDIATVHAELLFIHPFREGNGRTARLLANLMVHKQGYESLNFEKIDEIVFPDYVRAVQAAAKKNYEPMVKIIELVF